MWDLSLPSYAKINLGLYVTEKRPDGYHNIETIFQEVTFHDTLHFRRQEQALTLTSDHATLPLNEKNLIWKAVRLLQREAGCPTALTIHLEKRIPIGAGLGGGSSNAAAALMGLNQLYQSGLSQERLAALGAQLGSDVAFFIYGGTALATGRGEVIHPLADSEPFWVVLVNPGIHVSSAWAYKNLNLKLTNSEGLISVLPKLEQVTLIRLKQAKLRNMLEEPVIKQHPVIQTIKTRLYEYGAEWALMSGSGSTVIGVFHDQASAERTRLKMEQPGWLVIVTRTKSRRPEGDGQTESTPARVITDWGVGKR